MIGALKHDYMYPYRNHQYRYHDYHSRHPRLSVTLPRYQYLYHQYQYPYHDYQYQMPTNPTSASTATQYIVGRPTSHSETSTVSAK